MYVPFLAYFAPNEISLYFVRIHCQSSLHEGRLPCIKIPTRKIFDASHVVRIKLR